MREAIVIIYDIMYTVLCDMLSSMNICYKNSTYTEDHCLYNEYSSIKNKKIKKIKKILLETVTGSRYGS